MKELVLSIFAIIFGLHCWGQNNLDAVKEINIIKSDTAYICAESTVKEWETAYCNAKLLLIREIEDWLVSKGIKDISGVIATCDEHILKIKTTRGTLYRAFVYVNKDNLLPFKDKSKVVVVDMQPSDSIATASYSSDILSPLEKQMLDVKTFSMIEPFIKAHKRKGEISKYGKYADMPEEGPLYLFIYNRSGNIPACLRYDGSNTINLQNGNEEIISEQYKGCGAIWFQQKQQ